MSVRQFSLRNVPFTASKTTATYGGGTYGGETYGQLASDPLQMDEYVLVSDPGEWSTGSDWVFRVGDVGPLFQAMAVGLDGLLDLAAVAEAYLVIERYSPTRVAKAFVLTVDGANDKLTYSFVAGDLSDPGTYRVIVQLVFTSGRCMTLSPDDSATFLVRGVD